MKKKKVSEAAAQKPSGIKKYMPLIKFFGIFIGVIVFYYVALIGFGESIFTSYINLTAKLSGILINVFGGNVTVDGIRIISDNFVIFLSFGCEGSEAIMIFIAGVAAFPATIKQKLIGFFGGGLFLYFMNLFRIVLLYFIGKTNVGVFDSFHNEILPVLFIIFSLVVWAIWIKWTSKGIKKNENA